MTDIIKDTFHSEIKDVFHNEMQEILWVPKS